MKFTALAIPEVKLITPRIFRDDRGFLSETFNVRALAGGGVTGDFVQDNHSLSVEPGVVRGLHYQVPPAAQDKLIRVVRGSILDVAVDIRKGSPTYGQHVAVTLSAGNWEQLWIPKGFAHGFCTLEPNTEVIYKVTGYYAPDCDRGLRWNDPDLGIAWPVSAERAILSAKDVVTPLFRELDSPFQY